MREEVTIADNVIFIIIDNVSYQKNDLICSKVNIDE